jgi:hypothetical protein
MVYKTNFFFVFFFALFFAFYFIFYKNTMLLLKFKQANEESEEEIDEDYTEQDE